MDTLANDGTLINIDTNTTNLANFSLLVICRHNDNKYLTSDDSDDCKNYSTFSINKGRGRVICSPIYLPEIYKPASLGVSVAFFPNYLPRINPDLEGLL